MQNMQLKEVFIHSLFIVSIILVYSCSSTKDASPKTADSVFEKAIERFKKEDWEQATQLFDVIKLQYPASQYADDASFYLAEINYKKKEYILASFNYSMLRKVYPTSEYFKTAVYKTAMSLYELSPSYDRDQEYTYKAIDAFQDFQRLYPDDSLFKQVSNYIDKLREKLGLRSFNTAEIYRKMESFKSAVVYYDAVIEEFPDTKYLEPAYYQKIVCLATMRKFDDALSIIDLYKKKYPVGAYLKDIQLLEKSMNTPR